MTEEEMHDLYWELSQIYKKKFGEQFGMPVTSNLTTKDGIEIMKRAIETNTPHEWPKLPPGVLE